MSPVDRMHAENSTKATGLVDVHVHIKDSAGLQAVVAADVVAVRDVGFHDNREVWKRIQNARHHPPTVLSCGWALYKKGGYGARFGVAVETREEIKAEILKLKNAGADIIKVMASGVISLKEPGTVTAGGFALHELQFIVDEAQRQGLDVMAHANGEEAIVSCATARVRSVEHGFFMTERALDALAQNEIFWTPTVGAMVRAAEAGSRKAISQDVRHFVDRLIRSHVAMIQRAHEVGVPLAVGTDCVLPTRDYKHAYRSELGYFEQAGIPRTGVIAIATSGGAKLLGI
jgi:imidazolonepropionase-like amidohydrolase